MKQLLIYCLLLITCHSFADMPGNKPRPDYEVRITGLASLSDFTFFYQAEDSTELLKDSSVLLIRGGFGAPRCAAIWAVHKKIYHTTDTIVFCSGDKYYSFTAQFNIADNHLSFMEKEVIAVPEEDSTDAALISAIPVAPDNHKKILYGISGLSFMLLLAMSLWVWNKNRNIKRQV